MDHADHEGIPKDIPRWEEASAVPQQCEAQVDSQIELFGHWGGVT